MTEGVTENYPYLILVENVIKQEIRYKQLETLIFKYRSGSHQIQFN